jgi:hypothetical protein
MVSAAWTQCGGQMNSSLRTGGKEKALKLEYRRTADQPTKAALAGSISQGEWSTTLEIEILEVADQQIHPHRTILADTVKNPKWHKKLA